MHVVPHAVDTLVLGLIHFLSGMLYISSSQYQLRAVFHTRLWYRETTITKYLQGASGPVPFHLYSQGHLLHFFRWWGWQEDSLTGTSVSQH